MGREAKHPVRTLEKSLELLEVLKEQNGGQIYELAEHLDLGESAVHNHLSTLREHGYVVKRDGEYRLGLKFLDLGGHTQNQDDLYRAANSVVNDLASRTGERVLLAVEQQEIGVYLTQSNSTQSSGLETHSGQRFELHTEPVGRAILSGLSSERVTEIFDRRGVDPDVRESTEAELETIRDRGYAIGSTPRRDERSVAAPISTEDGRVLGALGVAGSVFQHDESWFNSELPKLVSDSVVTVENNLKSMFLRDAWIESSTVRE